MNLLKNIKAKRKDIKKKEPFKISLVDKINYLVNQNGLDEEFLPKLDKKIEGFLLAFNSVIGFKKGAKVKIRDNSEYSSQSEAVGILKGSFYEEESSDNYKHVDFEDGYGNAYRKEDLELVKISVQHKEETKFPLFFLTNKKDYELSKKVLEKIKNPYLNFTNTLEEITYCNQLFKINPSLNEDNLRKFDFVTLIHYEFAQKELEKLKQNRANLKKEITNIGKDDKNALKELSVKIDFENNQNKSQYMENLVNKIKIDYIKEKLSVEENTIREIKNKIKKESFREGFEKVSTSEIEEGDYIRVKTKNKYLEGKYKCSCSGNIKVEGSCIKYKEILKKTHPSIAFKLFGEDSKIGKSYKEAVKVFASKDTDENLKKELEKSIRRSMKVFLQDGVLEKKLRELGNKIFNSANTQFNLNNLEDYIGTKVKVYPGGNPNGKDYDCGGNTNSIPSGSLGIIERVENKSEKKFNIKFKNYEDWVVKLREIKLTESFYYITEKYKISDNLAKAIAKKNYKSILSSCKKEKTSELKKELYLMDENLDKINDFIRKMEAN